MCWSSGLTYSHKRDSEWMCLQQSAWKSSCYFNELRWMQYKSEKYTHTLYSLSIVKCLGWTLVDTKHIQYWPHCPHTITFPSTNYNTIQTALPLHYGPVLMALQQSFLLIYCTALTTTIKIWQFQSKQKWNNNTEQCQLLQKTHV